MTWAGEPKTKEFMTTALGVQHNNCSLVVDAMEEKKAVVLVDKQKGLYQACPIVEELLAKVLREIATDRKLVDSFAWTGYRIYYAVEYPYLSPRDKRKFVWEKFKLRTAFWFALVGLLAALFALSEHVKVIIDILKSLFSGQPGR